MRKSTEKFTRDYIKFNNYLTKLQTIIGYNRRFNPSTPFHRKTCMSYTSFNKLQQKKSGLRYHILTTQKPSPVKWKWQWRAKILILFSVMTSWVSFKLALRLQNFVSIEKHQSYIGSYLDRACRFNSNRSIQQICELS